MTALCSTTKKKSKREPEREHYLDVPSGLNLNLKKDSERPKGIALWALRRFAEDYCSSYGFEFKLKDRLTVDRIENWLTCDLQEIYEFGNSYINVIKDDINKDGVPAVAPATVYVAYNAKTTTMMGLVEVLESLDKFDKSSLLDTVKEDREARPEDQKGQPYLWFHMLCGNRKIMNDRVFSETAVFDGYSMVLERIGRLVAVRLPAVRGLLGGPRRLVRQVLGRTTSCSCLSFRSTHGGFVAYPQVLAPWDAPDILKRRFPVFELAAALRLEVENRSVCNI